MGAFLEVALPAFLLVFAGAAAAGAGGLDRRGGRQGAERFRLLPRHAGRAVPGGVGGRAAPGLRLAACRGLFRADAGAAGGGRGVRPPRAGRRTRAHRHGSLFLEQHLSRHAGDRGAYGRSGRRPDDGDHRAHHGPVCRSCPCCGSRRREAGVARPQPRWGAWSPIRFWLRLRSARFGRCCPGACRGLPPSRSTCWRRPLRRRRSPA